MSEIQNPRVQLLGQMIGRSPEFWPFPIPKMLGMNLLEIEEGRIKASVTVKKEWLNPLGIMHGGIMITFMDELMGMCSFSLNREHGHASINLNTDFLVSAREGEVITGEAYLVRKGKTVVHAESKLYKENGALMAKSTSNLVAVKF